MSRNGDNVVMLQDAPSDGRRATVVQQLGPWLEGHGVAAVSGERSTLTIRERDEEMIKGSWNKEDAAEMKM